MKRIYFDNAATTAPYAGIAEEMARCAIEYYGNPSSQHEEGRRAAERLEDCRARMAACLGCRPDELYFTSGGTESVRLGITAAAAGVARSGKKHIIASAFEHRSVLDTLSALEESGFEITLLGVGGGFVRPEALEAAIREDTALVTVMYANNEIGSIQPIDALAGICNAHGVTFHTDAVQAAGHMDIPLGAAGPSLMSLSAHKFHGPKGAGALYIRRGTQVKAQSSGPSKERALRPGTEDLPAVLGMTLALERSLSSLSASAAHMRELRAMLIHGIESAGGRCLYTGGPHLEGIISFVYDGIDGGALLQSLDMEGVSVSHGSACESGEYAPSHVLLAAGADPETARNALRISLCASNTAKEAEEFCLLLRRCTDRLRSLG